MRRSGLGFIIILIVALLVAFLLAKQLQSPISVPGQDTEQTMVGAVQSAQNAVDALNAAMEQSALPEIP
ncbi:MAG: hypothetical protein IJ649_02065 [Oscillospiraceae bacterium]|nr:hypothetical protein [Oscillospiraceae bacterium]